MELKINVDETMFKDIIEKELNAFSKDELHEIIRNCIIEAFKTDPKVSKFFVSESTYGWSTKLEPSPLLIKAAETLDLSSAFKDVQNQMIRMLKENYKEVLENAMLRAIKHNFFNDQEFQNQISYSIDFILSRRANE